MSVEQPLQLSGTLTLNITHTLNECRTAPTVEWYSITLNITHTLNECRTAPTVEWYSITLNITRL